MSGVGSFNTSQSASDPFNLKAQLSKLDGNIKDFIKSSNPNEINKQVITELYNSCIQLNQLSSDLSEVEDPGIKFQNLSPSDIKKLHEITNELKRLKSSVDKIQNLEVLGKLVGAKPSSSSATTQSQLERKAGSETERKIRSQIIQSSQTTQYLNLRSAAKNQLKRNPLESPSEEDFAEEDLKRRNSDSASEASDEDERTVHFKLTENIIKEFEKDHQDDQKIVDELVQEFLNDKDIMKTWSMVQIIPNNKKIDFDPNENLKNLTLMVVKKCETNPKFLQKLLSVNTRAFLPKQTNEMPGDWGVKVEGNKPTKMRITGHNILGKAFQQVYYKEKQKIVKQEIDLLKKENDSLKKQLSASGLSQETINKLKSQSEKLVVELKNLEEEYKELSTFYPTQNTPPPKPSG